MLPRTGKIYPIRSCLLLISQKKSLLSTMITVVVDIVQSTTRNTKITLKIHQTRPHSTKVPLKQSILIELRYSLQAVFVVFET